MRSGSRRNEGREVRGDGIGPVKTASEARQGFWGAPVLKIMVMSLILAAIAALILWGWFATYGV